MPFFYSARAVRLTPCCVANRCESGGAGQACCPAFCRALLVRNSFDWWRVDSRVFTRRERPGTRAGRGFRRRVTTRHTGRSNACAHRRGLCAQTHFACSSAGALRMRKIVSSPTANSAGVGDAQLRCAAHRHVRLMSMNAQPVAAQVIRQPGRMTGQCERGRLAKPTSKVSASL